MYEQQMRLCVELGAVELRHGRRMAQSILQKPGTAFETDCKRVNGRRRLDKAQRQHEWW